ncbi:MAG TPA: AI-2E family transporter [Anaerohalosphaeraceae bacterium]|nr:AI-2E family transporter [Anaerohalosphaeraceae bacterium]
MTAQPSSHSTHTGSSGTSTISQILIPLAALVIIIAGLRAAVSIIVPFLMAVFLAIIATPALFWLQKKRIPTGLAVFILSAVILIAGLLLGALLAATIADFTRALPEFEKNLQKTIVEWTEWFSPSPVSDSSPSGEESIGRRAEEKVHAILRLIQNSIQRYIHPNEIVNILKDLLSQLGGILTNGFLIFLTTVFILLEASILPAKIRAAMQQSPQTFENLARMADDVKRYLAIKTAISLLTGLLITIWLIVLKVNYAVLWGLIAFLLNFVPTIGSLVAAVPAVLMALLQGGPGTALLTALGYLVVNVVLGNFIEPRMLGRHLGLSVLVVFLSLVFWGWILGPFGMLLAVPLTMLVKIILQSRPDTQWLATLLGSEKPSLPTGKK